MQEVLLYFLLQNFIQIELSKVFQLPHYTIMRGIDYHKPNYDYLTKTGFMDNRGNRNNYTLKLFDRAYEKIGQSTEI